jgi:hypothetical protein
MSPSYNNNNNNNNNNNSSSSSSSSNDNDDDNNAALEGGKLSTSRLGRVTPGERNPAPTEEKTVSGGGGHRVDVFGEKFLTSIRIRTPDLPCHIVAPTPTTLPALSNQF